MTMFKINTVNYCDDFMSAINQWSNSKSKNMIINRLEILTTLCHIFENDSYGLDAIIHELSYKGKTTNETISSNIIYCTDENEDYISMIARIAEKYSFNHNFKLKSVSIAYFQYMLLPALSGYTEELINTSNHKTRYHLKRCISLLLQLPESINTIVITKKHFTVITSNTKNSNLSARDGTLTVPSVVTTKPTVYSLLNFKKSSKSMSSVKANTTIKTDNSSRNNSSSSSTESTSTPTTNLPTLIYYHEQLLTELLSHLHTPSSSSSSSSNNFTTATKRKSITNSKNIKNNNGQVDDGDDDDVNDWYNDFSTDSNFNTNKNTNNRNKKSRTHNRAVNNNAATIIDSGTRVSAAATAVTGSSEDNVITWIDENSMDSASILSVIASMKTYSPLQSSLQPHSVTGSGESNTVMNAIGEIKYQFPMDLNISKIIGAKVAQYFTIPITNQSISNNSSNSSNESNNNNNSNTNESNNNNRIRSNNHNNKYSCNTEGINNRNMTDYQIKASRTSRNIAGTMETHHHGGNDVMTVECGSPIPILRNIPSTRRSDSTHDTTTTSSITTTTASVNITNNNTDNNSNNSSSSSSNKSSNNGNNMMMDNFIVDDAMATITHDTTGTNFNNESMSGSMSVTAAPFNSSTPSRKITGNTADNNHQQVIDKNNIKINNNTPNTNNTATSINSNKHSLRNTITTASSSTTNTYSNNTSSRKRRNHKVAFIGTVTKFAPESTYQAKDELYHVVWEDGDECDYNTKEFSDGMTLYQKLFGNKVTSSSNESISNNNSSSNESNSSCSCSSSSGSSTNDSSNLSSNSNNCSTNNISNESSSNNKSSSISNNNNNNNSNANSNISTSNESSDSNNNNSSSNSNSNNNNAVVIDDSVTSTVNRNADVTDDSVTSTVNRNADVTDDSVTSTANRNADVTDNSVTSTANRNADVTDNSVTSTANRNTDVTDDSVTSTANRNADVTDDSVTSTANRNADVNDDSVTSTANRNTDVTDNSASTSCCHEQSHSFFDKNIKPFTNSANNLDDTDIKVTSSSSAGVQ